MDINNIMRETMKEMYAHTNAEYLQTRAKNLKDLNRQLKTKNTNIQYKYEGRFNSQSFGQWCFDRMYTRIYTNTDNTPDSSANKEFFVIFFNCNREDILKD